MASSGLVQRKSGAGGYDHRGGEAAFLRPLAANHPAVDPASVFSRIPAGICSWMGWMIELPLRPGHRHPSTASFSLSTKDTTVSKVSSVPFPTSGSHDADASN